MVSLKMSKCQNYICINHFQVKTLNFTHAKNLYISASEACLAYRKLIMEIHVHHFQVKTLNFTHAKNLYIWANEACPSYRKLIMEIHESIIVVFFLSNNINAVM